MIKLKKLLPMIVVATMIGGVMTGCSNSGSDNADTKKSESTDESKSESNSNILIGSAIYKFDDTFMTGVRTAMEKQSDAEGVKIELVDSQNKQPTQNEQVDTFITKGVNALAVNAVDRTAAGPIIEKAKAKDLPIVFLNREPEEADMQSYDKVWYVGAKAEQSGTQSGEIIVDYFKENPEADKNGDGVIQYVMLQGEPGHQDATLRTEYSIKAIEDGGFKAEKLAADTAMWDKAKATDLMKAFITGQGLDKIEAVLCNNDDMALGAISAFENANIKLEDRPIIVGIDGIPEALNCIKGGTLKGTVFNDYIAQSEMIIDIAYDLKYNEDSKLLKKLNNTRQFKTTYKKITSENVDNYINEEELEQ